jgi:glycosyltransferase involved in cell wall biosynthesis
VQAQLLRSAGHEVDQIALPAIGATWRWPFKAVALPIRLAGYVPIAQRLQRGSYDVVHVHWLTHGVVGLMARRPFFVQAHGSDVHLNLNNPVYRRITRAVLKRARLVFYVTPELREPLAEARERLRYLPNPVDVDALVPESLPSRVKNVLIFTRLDSAKGVDRIFPAVERLSHSFEITALDWGPLARGYVRSYRKWVRFVRPVAHSKIAPFLHGFDVVIGQMRQGTLGLSEVEALAAGRPVITGIDSSLYGGDAPPVIGASGPDGIATALEQLSVDGARRDDLARQGIEWARRNHGLEHHLDLLEAAYFG